jgi:phage terminase small subunit
VGQSVLTPKQERFVQEYLIDLNASAAARRAGYREGSAAARLMKDAAIYEAIAEAAKARAATVQVQATEVLEELKRLAFLDPAQFFDAQGQLLPVAMMPESARRALSSLKWGKGGPELRFADKLRALEMLGRHLKLFGTELQLDGARRVTVVIDMGGDDE